MYVRFKKDEKHIEFSDGDERNEISDSHETFEDCGYVLEKGDLVVDIDNIPQSKVRVLTEMFNINTQIVWSNSDEKDGHYGAHLYFKKPDGFKQIKAVCALGFEVEYKHLPKAKYVTIKRHGKVRRIDNEGVREELPDCLKPRVKGTYKNMLSLDEGEGRNASMFDHKITIMTIPYWRKILNFINDHVFEKPFEKKEMEHLLRDQDVVAKKDNQYEMATMFMQEYNTTRFNNLLFFKQGGKYECDDPLLTQLVWRRCQGMSTTYVREIVNQIKERSKIIPRDMIFPIRFNNGILVNGEFVEMQYEDFTPYTIEIDYKPDAKPVEAVDKYLNHLTDSDSNYRLFIGEVLGHTLIKDRNVKNTVPHIFFFIGGGGNGKGTLLRIVEKIVQSKNVSGLDITELTNEKYLININNKLVNLGDDVEDKPINTKEMKKLKNISSCDTIQMRKLYEQAESVVPTATLIFTSNHVIKTFEKGDSVKRRFMWCPMYTKVDKKDPEFIPSITTKEALEYWVRLMVEGYLRIYKNGRMTEAEPVSLETAKYHVENNQSTMYIEDLTVEDVELKKPKDIYDDYSKWCENEGTEPTSQRIFYHNVEERFNLEKKAKKLDGATHRVWSCKESE